MLTNIDPLSLLRLKQVLQYIPVSRATWWNGCRTGRYPTPVKEGSCTFWRGRDIIALLERIGQTSEN